MKRNGTVSIVKFVFCLVIILMHYSIPAKVGQSERLFEGGYIYVDFFFILQGFYLIKRSVDIENRQSCDAIAYIKGRIRRFFPCVTCMAILLFLLQLNTMITIKQFAMRILEGTSINRSI